MQIEAEFRRRNRSGTDYALEKTKIVKSFDDIEKKLNGQVRINELFVESVGCLIENALISCTLQKKDEANRGNIQMMVLEAVKGDYFTFPMRYSAQKLASLPSKKVDAATSTVNLSKSPCEQDSSGIDKILRIFSVIADQSQVSYKGIQIQKDTLIELNFELMNNIKSKLLQDDLFKRVILSDETYELNPKEMGKDQKLGQGNNYQHKLQLKSQQDLTKNIQAYQAPIQIPESQFESLLAQNNSRNSANRVQQFTKQLYANDGSGTVQTSFGSTQQNFIKNEHIRASTQLLKEKLKSVHNTRQTVLRQRKTDVQDPYEIIQGNRNLSHNTQDQQRSASRELQHSTDGIPQADSSTASQYLTSQRLPNIMPSGDEKLAKTFYGGGFKSSGKNSLQVLPALEKDSKIGLKPKVSQPSNIENSDASIHVHGTNQGPTFINREISQRNKKGSI